MQTETRRVGRRPLLVGAAALLTGATASVPLFVRRTVEPPAAASPPAPPATPVPETPWRYLFRLDLPPGFARGEQDEQVVYRDRAIAESVVLERQRLLVPFRIDHLPDGFRIHSVRAKQPHPPWTPTPGQPRIAMRYPELVTVAATCGGDTTRRQPPNAIGLGFRQDDLTERRRDDRPVVVHGRPAFIQTDRFGATVIVPYDEYEFSVNARRGVADVHELATIAERLKPAARPLDHSTWFDASTALPR